MHGEPRAPARGDVARRGRALPASSGFLAWLEHDELERTDMRTAGPRFAGASPTPAIPARDMDQSAVATDGRLDLVLAQNAKR
jgi:hypothetical protein